MKIFASIFFLVSVTFAQFEQRSAELPLDTVATVGSHVVSARDFLERFELMPWPRKDQASRIEFSKLEFLYSMVAEKLLAIEASAQNIGFDSVSLNAQHNFERLFVRDEFYKQEVLPKIAISDAERREGLLRFPYEIEVEILGIVSKQDGELLRKKVIQSKNKKAIFRRYTDSLFVVIDTLRVSYGSVDKKIEDIVYALGKDSLSFPLEVENRGMVMFRLLKKNIHEQNARFSHPDRLHKVENVLKQRKEDSLAIKTFAQVTSPQKAEANPDMFYRLADSVIFLLQSDSTSYGSNGMYRLPSTAINQLEKKFNTDLSKQFISIASGDMTLGDVLLGLSNNNVVFPSLNPDHIRIVLNNNIKTVIQNELLAREGLKKNLHQSNAVKHDVATWLDNRKSWLLARTVMDSVQVTDNDIETEYQKYPQQYGATVLVRMKEILVDSADAAITIINRINKGEEFSTLAKKYSKRKEWANNGGESPWIDISMHGDLGTFASSANIGELNGPRKTKEGFTVFTVLDRKIQDDSVKTNYINAKKTIAQKLLNEKKQKTLDKFIGTLAKKYNVALYENTLRQVKTTTTSMVTWRNIGFGGRVLAVPQMIPQTQWVYEWLQQQRVNQ